MKVFNLRDATHKSDFATSCERTVFHLLRNLVGNQYPEVLGILVPPEILVPREISVQFEMHCLCSSK